MNTPPWQISAKNSLDNELQIEKKTYVSSQSEERNRSGDQDAAAEHHVDRFVFIDPAGAYHSASQRRESKCL